MLKNRVVYPSKYNDSAYWERVKRNLGWLGDTEKEQRERQMKIRDAVIGVAGCGGIGGSVAVRLARLGVRRIKIADPDHFDFSNINRQVGSGQNNLGKNKAETIAQIIHEMTNDVEVEVFPEGITENNADEFVSGCDYLMDKIDFLDVAHCYALHRAFRKNKTCRFVLRTPVIGPRIFVFKYTHTSMQVEEFYDLPDSNVLTNEVAERLVERLAPELPNYPSKQTLIDWFVHRKCVPILSNSPPIAEGVVATQMILAITGLDQLAEAQKLPELPGYMMFDAVQWKTKVVREKWW